MTSNGLLSINGGDAVGADSSHTPPDPQPQRPKRAAQTPPAPAADSGQRLIIQQDAETGDCTYTVIDRDTGKVLARVSREEVARMGGAADYAAGDLVKAKA